MKCIYCNSKDLNLTQDYLFSIGYLPSYFILTNGQKVDLNHVHPFADKFYFLYDYDDTKEFFIRTDNIICLGSTIEYFSLKKNSLENYSSEDIVTSFENIVTVIRKIKLSSIT